MKIGFLIYDDGILSVLQEQIHALRHDSIISSNIQEIIEKGSDLIFLEWNRNNVSGTIEGIKAAAQNDNPIPVIVFVPPGAIDAMHRAYSMGAADVIFYPPDEDEIRAEIEEIARDKNVIDLALKETFRKLRDETLVGESMVFRRCLEEVKIAAHCDANVLILGETGTGKEMVSQAIHKLSNRSGNRFVAVNCASIPSELLESELFGHSKGAFTGADQKHSGRFEIVGAGTLLLDEIGDMELSLQIKLLRVIEQRVFQRLGENEDIPFHARLISATKVDLDKAVQEGRFRSDLLGRIDQVRIELPPLRERLGDIPILIRHFLNKHAKGRTIIISSSAMETFEQYYFPMNIRQLENAVISALAHSEPGNVILSKHLPKEIRFSRELQKYDPEHIFTVPESLSYKEAREFAERKIDYLYLTNMLKKHGGNLSNAAKEAGIDRKTFNLRLEQSSKDIKENRPDE